MNRRRFLTTSLAASALAFPGCAYLNLRSDDALIRAGTRAAIDKSLLPALTEKAYPGHFTISAKAQTYGVDNTWPGLDSWQMAGAYLLLGRHREVLDYFDFVQAAQRQDGNIPFAVFRGDKPHPSGATWLRAMRYPEDVFTYTPKTRQGQRADLDFATNKWIGLYDHWQTKANPLSVLGPVCYVLTGWEIWAAIRTNNWLEEKLSSLEAAGNYLASRVSPNGLIGGAGFYLEAPPRNQWDGVTQCYVIQVFRQLAAMNRVIGRDEKAAEWTQKADKLSNRFNKLFWVNDHYAEFIHPVHGLVDKHGLTDVNWAAIAFRVASEERANTMWPLLLAEKNFWRGDMPTHVVTKIGNFEPWEFAEPVPFLHDKLTFDIAAMGRVWHLEGLACLRMRDFDRLRRSVLHVCRMGRKHNWYWYERYPAVTEDRVKPVGTYGYCEYPAVLVRLVLGNSEIFPEAVGALP